MIRLEKVGIQFNGQWLFRHLDFSVAQGECAVIVGPSGHGKSVLLRMIAGLLSPQEGKVHVATEDIGMLFQKNALFDSLTVEENLLFPLRERKKLEGKEAHDRVRALLEAVQLNGHEQKNPDQLSGGMQKRLGMIRALVMEPELILYDEPTAGLDPVTSRTIARLIQEFGRQEGRTAVVVTNEVNRALQLGDRIWLLAQGKLWGGLSAEGIRQSQIPEIRQFFEGKLEGPLGLIGAPS